MIDIASASRLVVGPDSSETLSSSGSSNGDRSTRCVRESAGGSTATRTLLCRDVGAMLDGAMLRGRYGGGGSSRLLPSANGSLADVTDTMSDVSIPVR
jgi:hypothetical protein